MAEKTGNLSTNSMSRSEGRLQEGPADGELVPEPGARPSPPPPVDVDEGEEQVRIELLRRIIGASYPATRNDLLRHIGPDERGPVEARLRMIPADVRFDSPEEVVTAFGGMSARH